MCCRKSWQDGVLSKLNSAAVVALIGFGFASIALATDYQSLKSRAVADCEEIDAKEYQSGLWMNPDGFSSFYKRSACFQRAAIDFRAVELCKKVKRRFALFSSSWGYSKSNCRKLTRLGAGDRLLLLGLPDLPHATLAEGAHQAVGTDDSGTVA